MVPCLAPGEGSEWSVAIFTVVEGTLAAMEIVVVVSAAGGAKGAREARGAGEAMEVGDAVKAREALDSTDVVRAVELMEYMEAGEVECAVGEVKVVGIAVAGASNSYIATALATVILAEIQICSLL
jgi:hypothetical protein